MSDATAYLYEPEPKCEHPVTQTGHLQLTDLTTGMTATSTDPVTVCLTCRTVLNPTATPEGA